MQGAGGRYDVSPGTEQAHQITLMQWQPLWRGALAGEKNRIEEAVAGGGGKFTKELRKNDCTHLISVSAKGDKYHYAKEWRSVQIVTPQWFFDSLEKQGVCRPVPRPIGSPPPLKDATLVNLGPCSLCSERADAAQQRHRAEPASPCDE